MAAKKSFDWSPLIETSKEVGRVVLLSVISWGLAKLASLPETETTLIGTILLRGVDKWLHESGVATKGITRF